ncbi:hypothetical protein VHUM_03544 [Vanrija humicola]|uniref:Uncharacterized protein n=1 Tax=Vanrija humicola TaxID=5417 RepID=A0A7D8UZV5_VANHU|nr:hypothetical protein VHUM_03544 [Vanrija humicola]
MAANTLPTPIATPARPRGGGGAYNFRKQPIPPLSDAEVISSDDQKPKPVSLLSSMLSDHASPPRLEYMARGRSGSSTPSTAISSPKANDHGDPVSILRRSSIGSDCEPFRLPLARVITPAPKDQEPAVHRPGALKFAVATNHPDPERPIVPLPVDHSGGDHLTDDGYEEDSEDGFSDDEPSFMFHVHKLLEQGRGRQTSCLIKERPASTSPTRGAESRRLSRDHIRVDPSAGRDHNRCSRHQSPPPSARPDSHFRSARPGPREGRAGSPIPSSLPNDEDEDEDDDEEGEGDEEGEEGASMEGTVRSCPEADTAIEEDSDSSDPSAPPMAALMPATVSASLGNGVRSILRRASEHLPGFRPSLAATPPEATTTPATSGDLSFEDQPTLGRAKSLGSRPNRRPDILLSTTETAALAPSRPIACPSRGRPNVGYS